MKNSPHRYTPNSAHRSSTTTSSPAQRARRRRAEPEPAVHRDSLTVDELRSAGEDWIVQGEINGISKRSLEARRFIVDKLVWFLTSKGHTSCGPPQVKAFLSHVQRGHETPEGRWGDGNRGKIAVRPRTAQTYFTSLQAWLRYAVRQKLLDESPLESDDRPISRPDQIRPFTTEQVAALLAAAERSRFRLRDVAILTLLFDSGLRASELCSLKRRDVDFTSSALTVVEGKGKKTRSVPFGKQAKRALWEYLRADPRDAEDIVFWSERGANGGEGLSRSGLLQLFRRLGKLAGINGVRCSPHTMRHSFAIAYLRNGGDPLRLQWILGHSHLSMTQKYVALASADVAAQHREVSPADRLKRQP